MWLLSTAAPGSGVSGQRHCGKRNNARLAPGPAAASSHDLMKPARSCGAPKSAASADCLAAASKAGRCSRVTRLRGEHDGGELGLHGQRGELEVIVSLSAGKRRSAVTSLVAPRRQEGVRPVQALPTLRTGRMKSVVFASARALNRVAIAFVALTTFSAVCDKIEEWRSRVDSENLFLQNASRNIDVLNRRQNDASATKASQRRCWHGESAVLRFRTPKKAANLQAYLCARRRLTEGQKELLVLIGARCERGSKNEGKRASSK